MISALAIDSGRITGNPEVIGSSFGLVPKNALVFIDLASSGCRQGESNSRALTKAGVTLLADTPGSGRARGARVSGFGTFDGSDARFCVVGLEGEISSGAGLDELGFAGPLEEGESGAGLPGLRPT